MAGTNDYKGCKIIIHDDESGNIIAETSVVAYDKKAVVISVDEKVFESNPCERVSLLILHPEAIYEFKGTVRKKALYGTREIGLFKGKEKESRMTKRYVVNLPARVENLVIANRLVELRTPREVLLINISTEGVLIKTKAQIFNVGTTFQLKLMIGGSETSINTSVVRIGNVDEGDVECGCKFNFLYPQES